jgi:hypothetical protein
LDFRHWLYGELLTIKNEDMDMDNENEGNVDAGDAKGWFPRRCAVDSNQVHSENCPTAAKVKAKVLKKPASLSPDSSSNSKKEK